MKGPIMHSDDRGPHPVRFVGAGPGDPELITVKGMKTLQDADLVIYAGSLVPEAVLKWMKPDAVRVNSAGMHLDEIVEKMIRGYRDGKWVVRLHTGDPSLYGAIFEQMVRLREASVPFEIVPGVTAAFAAAATLGIEYTLPEVAQTLILTRIAGRTPVPETEALDSLAAHQTSMAIYLSISLIDEVRKVLEKHYGPEGKCAVVYRASHPDEKVFVIPVGSLTETVKREKIKRQALIIVGKILDFALENDVPVSKLYDRHFSHGFREAVSDDA